MSWITARNGQVPHGAVCAGRDVSGGPIFVARAHHNGDIVPGKLVQSTTVHCFENHCHGRKGIPGDRLWVKNANPTSRMYLSWGGAEHYKNDYEVLGVTRL